MPCGNLDHEHPSWPQQGAHEFIIEACENHCGWCGYQTKMANNLRVHARRHLTNENETRLRGIKIVKGKAGRKKVQMAKRRFTGSEACEETPARSSSVDNLNSGVNPDQPGIDLAENPRREHRDEALHPPPAAFAPHDQLLPGLSLKAIKIIDIFILQPLTEEHKLPHTRDKILFGMEIICLRDLENYLLRIAMTISWETIAKKIYFSILVIRCIKNAVPFLEYHDLVRPTDQPYNERYFMEVEGSLKAQYQHFGSARERESGLNREAGQDQREELCYSIGMLHGADTQVEGMQMIPDIRLGGRRGPQERDVNKTILGIEEVHSYNPSNQRSIQEAAQLPGESTQIGISQQPNQSQLSPVRSCLLELGYSEVELDRFLLQLGPDSIADIDRRLLLTPSPAFSQAQNDRSELQIPPIQESQARATRLSRNAFKKIHKEVLLPLLRRSSLQGFKILVLGFAGRIFMPGIRNLRDIEEGLFSHARKIAVSGTAYLRFCSYLLRCIKLLISEDGCLSDEEKTHPHQLAYSEAYFFRLFKSIHTEVSAKKDLPEFLSAKIWRCPKPQCVLHQVPTIKLYMIVHLTEYHNEDFGYVCEEELAGRSIDPLHWRCPNCLLKNFVPQQGYVCGECKIPCAESRIKARAKLSSMENLLGPIPQIAPSAHASTIALSKSSKQDEISSLGTPLETGQQTLQPHLNLPEPVTRHRDALQILLQHCVDNNGHSTNHPGE